MFTNQNFLNITQGTRYLLHTFKKTIYRVHFFNQNRKCKIEEQNRTNFAFYETNRVIAQQMFIFTTILLICNKYRLYCHEGMNSYIQEIYVLLQKK